MTRRKATFRAFVPFLLSEGKERSGKKLRERESGESEWVCVLRKERERERRIGVSLH